MKVMRVIGANGEKEGGEKRNGGLVRQPGGSLETLLTGCAAETTKFHIACRIGQRVWRLLEILMS